MMRIVPFSLSHFRVSSIQIARAESGMRTGIGKHFNYPFSDYQSKVYCQQQLLFIVVYIIDTESKLSSATPAPTEH